MKDIEVGHGSGKDNELHVRGNIRILGVTDDVCIGSGLLQDSEHINMVLVVTGVPTPETFFVFIVRCQYRGVQYYY
jgi:hypothetical protein